MYTHSAQLIHIARLYGVLTCILCASLNLLIWGGALRDVTNNGCVRDYFDLLYSLLLTMSFCFFFIA